MIIDAHAHLGQWYFPTIDPDPAAMSAGMRRLGIQRTILSSALAIVYDFREGNRLLDQAIRPYPGLLAYVAVNLNYPAESLLQIDTYLRERERNRFVGIKVHPLLCQRSFDCDEGLRIAEAAARWHVPILIHTFGSTIESPRTVMRAAEKFPEVSFILAHMGGYNWEEGIAVAVQRPNTILEVCSTCTDPRKIRQAIQAVGPERVLFGTDSSLFLPEYMWGAMQDMDLSAEEYRLIMGENASRLFGLEGMA
jgi:predicted TIM-barrel fold metal-dependent hydrolase